MMQAVENRMVLGAYYPDTDREYILDTSTPEKYAEYVYDNNLETLVFSKWLGVEIATNAAADLWDHMEPDFVAGLCKSWVEDNALDDFIDWRNINGRFC